MNTETYQIIPLQLAPLLDAVSHPARVQIMMHLAKYHGCSAGSISDKLPLAKSTVSAHLGKLREAGLIISEENGVSLKYSMNETGYNLMKDILSDFFTTIDECRSYQTECCDVNVEKMAL